MEVSSLQTLCKTVILTNRIFRSLEATLQTYQILKNIYKESIILLEIWNSNLTFVKTAFPSMLSKYGEDKLKEILEEDDFINCMNDYNEHLKARKQFSYLKGTVLDRPTPTYGVSKDLNNDTSSVLTTNEDGYYPTSVLLEGLKWPNDVVASKRETYLSALEFQSIFGMTKEEYSKLANHIKVRLKKQYKLF
eukprot:gene16639-22738_t